MVLNGQSVLQRISSSAQRVQARGGTKLSFLAMGTHCEVTAEASGPVLDRFFAAALDWVAAFEAKYSRFLPESLISRINAAAGEHWVDVDPDTERLFKWYNELFFVTQRAFDPTTLPLLRLWNWKAEPPRVPTASEVAAARELVGWNKVQRRPGAIFLPKPGMGLDLGGLGKEFAVDCIAELAGACGVRSCLVNFGQDIRVTESPKGLPAWHVGLEDPRKPGSCWTGVAAKSVAVATSGDYHRSFSVDGRRYGHILDPRTGWPVENRVLAVSVIAPTCTLAGALSTSAFILGPDAGLKLIAAHAGAEGCLFTANERYETKRFSEFLTR